MATFTWIGGNDGNLATDSANWSPTSLPGAGDTLLMLPAVSPGSTIVESGGTLTNNVITIGTLNSGTLVAAFDTLTLSHMLVSGGTLTVGSNGTAGQGGVVNITDSTLSGATLAVGNNATINAFGDTALTGTLADNGGGTPDVIAGSVITGNNGVGITTTGSNENVVLNARGNVRLDNLTLADSSGGTFTINPTVFTPNGGTTTAGNFVNTGGLLVVGDSLSITHASNAKFSNADLILAASGSVSLTASMAPVTGAIALASSTVDIDTNMPGSQLILFEDAANNNTLRIEAAATIGNPGSTVLSAFTARIAGFQAGDTIDLVGISTSGLTESFEDGVLSLSQGGSVIGTLRFVATDAPDAPAGSSSFVLTQSGTDTVVTTTQTNDMLTNYVGGGAVDWSDAALWSTSAVPGATQVAEIVNGLTQLNDFISGSPSSYVLTVNTAETTGAVVLADNFATMAINASLTLQKLSPSASSGGSFTQDAATIDVDAGGSLAGTRFVQTSGKFDIAAGGSVTLSGLAPSAAASGFQAIDIENDATIDGMVNASGGAFSIGDDAGASGANVTLENGGTVQASFTQIGAEQDGNGYLSVTGASSQWEDVGDAGNTADASPYLGDMIVGGGGYGFQGTLAANSSLSNGDGFVQIDQGATVQETGAAILGMVGVGSTGNTLDSQGNVLVQNDATWDIGTQLEVGGSHLYSGSGDLGGIGILNVNNGGAVQLGTAESLGLYKLAIGASAGSSGSVDVQGLDGSQRATLDAGGGPIVIGEAGQGTLSIGNNGAATAGSSNTTGFGWAVMIGDQVGSVGTLNLFSGGSSGAGRFTANGNMVVGNNGSGVVSIGGSTLTVGGTLYLGGTPSGKGSGSGDVSLNNGTAQVTGNVQMYQGSTLQVNASQLEIGSAGGAASGVLTVDAGHTLAGAGSVQITSLSGQLLNNGTVIANAVGGTLDFASNVVLAGSGVYAIGAGGTMKIDNFNPISVPVDFGVGSWTNTGTSVESLLPTVPGAFQGTVEHMFGSDQIVLSSVVVAQQNPQAHYTPNGDPTTGGQVQVSWGGSGTLNPGSMTFDVTGYHPGGFSVVVDGPGSAVVANDSAPCFAAGTRVLTARGEVAVEALLPGELVATLSGLRPVRWVGHTRVDLDRHPGRHGVAPVLVRACAFGPGVPHRDLVLSPDHAVWLDGALVPIHLLVNGATITRLPARGVVGYFHVELDRHAVLLAEGLPAESYLDTGNRAAFTGERGMRPLHADPCADLDARAWDDRAVAVLHLGGSVVTQAQRRLAERVTRLGFAITDDPGLVVETDREVLARAARPGLVSAIVPANTGRLVLRSRSSVPAELRGGAEDHRRLGVALTGLRFNGSAVPLDGCAFGAGFYPSEADSLLWTDGDAVLILPPLSQPAALELDVVTPGLRYWTGPAPLSGGASDGADAAVVAGAAAEQRAQVG